MLIIYFTSDSEQIQWADSAPFVGDRIPGTDQTINQVEVYRGEQETVYLALGRETFGAGEHTFDVQLRPDRSILNYGWSMVGKPPVGRLMDYEQTGHDTLMRPVPTRWYVDQIETCRPVSEGSYQAIYLCFCVDAPLVAAA